MESNKWFNCSVDVVGTNSIDDSLVAKEFKGSRWRTGKKKEVLKARNKNMKKITKLLVRQKYIGK